MLWLEAAALRGNSPVKHDCTSEIKESHKLLGGRGLCGEPPGEYPFSPIRLHHNAHYFKKEFREQLNTE